jgi:O-antigen ligase
MPEEKQVRIRTLWDKDAGPANAHESAEGRIEGFQVSWKMFRREPWTGVGAGGKNFIGYRLSNSIDEAGRESATQAHNLYGEVLAEFGVGGALCLAGLVASVLGCCVRARNRLADCGLTDSFPGSLAGAVAVCIMLLLFLGLGGHNFYRPLWLWLAAWAGVLVSLPAMHAMSAASPTEARSQ